MNSCDTSNIKLFNLDEKISVFSKENNSKNNLSNSKFLQLKIKLNHSEFIQQEKYDNKDKLEEGEIYCKTNNNKINEKKNKVFKLTNLKKYYKENEICIKCLKTGHTLKKCPNEKCHLCHQIDHREWNCPLRAKNKNIKDKLIFQMKLSQCEKCGNKGHKSSECLIIPDRIIINNTTNTPLCKFCNSNNHYICPFTEEIFILNDKVINNEKIDDFTKNYVNLNEFSSLLRYFKKENQKSEFRQKKCSLDIKEEEIKNTKFCCKCGGMHHFTECKEEHINNAKKK